MDWDGMLAGAGIAALGLGTLIYVWSSNYPIARIGEVKEIVALEEDGLKSRYGVVQVRYPDGSSRIFTTPWETVDCGGMVACKVSSPSLVDKLKQARDLGENVAVVISGDRIPSRLLMTPLIEDVSVPARQTYKQ